MKKLVYGLMAGIIVVGLMGIGTLIPTEATGGDEGPKVMVANPMVKMGKKATVTIVGSGFKPGQEVNLLFTTADGVQSDIGYSLEPQAKANKIGAFVTTWSCGDYVSKKLVKQGAYTITVTDTDYNILAHTPVAFYQEKAKKK